ncbi:5-oxoprolinase subunit B family protein [Hyphomonas pacifica]|uniref:Carboxyltransferase domain-containing protein n=1 Tax=Hyphomonas pacifica TaxID=1280941 RepID=A0A062TSH0_9PROT|nr:carboxyltransferase domain-containing protein [Hyphomonas pacifica]KCZ50771.1 hypothetical protein HY2_02645 [Hyphomonas pacifica]RAN34476.1 hypothetical protein HY3_10915 [Hyphomonas pacifica]
MILQKILACGDDAYRLMPSDNHQRHAIAEALRSKGVWSEVVVGRESVTVQYDPCETSPEATRKLILSALDQVNLVTQKSASSVTLRMRIDEKSAPELVTCAEANGLSANEFLDRITGSDLMVDMLGFAPGFAYVSGVGDALVGKRLEHPRQLTHAGSVGFIQGFLGIYALDGPGGWPIIGQVSERLFDKTSDNPVLLAPGTRIKLEVSQ